MTRLSEILQVGFYFLFSECNSGDGHVYFTFWLSWKYEFWRFGRLLREKFQGKFNIVLFIHLEEQNSEANGWWFILSSTVLVTLYFYQEGETVNIRLSSVSRKERKRRKADLSNVG